MLSNLLSDLRNTSKPGEKVDILKKYENDTEGYDYYARILAYYTYNPFILFNVKLRPKDIPTPGDKDFGELFACLIDDALEECANCNSNKQNRERLIPILEQLNEGSQELLVGIVNKNWKAGVSVKLINKAFPGLVKEFNVQLANSYKAEKHDDKIAGRQWSYKMDGVRCVAIRWPDGWKLYSRQGKEFLTVDHIKLELEELYQSELAAKEDCEFSKFIVEPFTFFDGELYKHGLTFEEVQGLAMSYTKGTAEELEYHVFAVGMQEDFFDQKIDSMMSLVKTKPYFLKKHIVLVEGGYLESIDQMNERLEKAFELGYEGIMLRDPHVAYDFKRSDALIKVKQFEEEGEIISDAIIREIRMDDFPVIEDGQMRYEKLLTRFEVEQPDGIMCGMGSGFNLDFRRLVAKDPDAFMDKPIEVKHQYWGKNGRMRFPRLHKIREDL